MGCSQRAANRQNILSDLDHADKIRPAGTASDLKALAAPASFALL